MPTTAFAQFAEFPSANNAQTIKLALNVSEDSIPMPTDHAAKQKKSNTLFQNPRLFDAFISQSTLTVNNWNISDLDSVGVGSSDVTISFWLRVLSKPDPQAVNDIFKIVNNDFEYKFTIDAVNNQCKFYAEDTVGVGELVNTIDNCKFEDLNAWKYFAISVGKDQTSFTSDINTYNAGVKNDTSTSFSPDGVFNLMSKDAQIQIYPANANANINFQLANVNILDYAPSDADLDQFAGQVPKDVDYFCTVVDSGSCTTCPEGASVDNRCKAQGPAINTGLKLSVEPQQIRVRDNISKPIASDSYAFKTWFYADEDAGA